MEKKMAREYHFEEVPGLPSVKTVLGIEALIFGVFILAYFILKALFKIIVFIFISIFKIIGFCFKKLRKFVN
jgi:hypothetical protein